MEIYGDLWRFIHSKVLERSNIRRPFGDETNGIYSLDIEIKESACNLTISMSVNNTGDQRHEDTIPGLFLIHIIHSCETNQATHRLLVTCRCLCSSLSRCSWRPRPSDSFLERKGSIHAEFWIIYLYISISISISIYIYIIYNYL